MKVLIIEDEKPAATRLKQLIHEIEPKAEVLDVLDSVEESVKWLQAFSQPDLIFMDIQLADGISFEIFEQVKVHSSIIFTTAFDHYAAKAFRVNSVDYLLKPIDPKQLREALARYHKVKTPPLPINYKKLLDSISETSPRSYKERFVVKLGEQLKHISVSDIAYFYSDKGHTNLISTQNKVLIIDHPLDQLIPQLNPKHFLRINRKLIIHIQSLAKTRSWFNSRYKLELVPKPDFDVIVSRDRVAEFKNWLDS